MVQTIGRLGGVSAAARELNTSQPAVTQAVSNLERDLGAEIFCRCATGTYPSEVGALFLRRIDRFFDILESGIQAAQAGGDGRRSMPLVERLVTGTQIRALIVVSEPARLEVRAEHLGVSSASFYRSVREMERALGRSLTDRTPNGPVCNKVGTALARELRKALREIDFARTEVREATDGEVDMEIVVGALPMSGSYVLAEAMRDFLALKPTARVRVITGDYPFLVNELGMCNIDMIFGLLRKPEWATDLDEEAFFQDSFCVVTRKGHPLAQVRDITPRHLADYDWVVPAEGTPRRAQIDSLFDGLEKRPRFGIETSSLATLRALLASSDLITIMTRSEVQFDANIDLVESLPCRFLAPLPAKGITTRSGWLPTEAHAAFLDCLRRATAKARHDGGRRRPAVKLVS
ncbi:LysR family transcriptional regulator [Rhodobacterales bacterium HKCCE2091]|nr:LysR family transcriptional regulator [Rhodobacterales bacterium HKCCE2091]